MRQKILLIGAGLSTQQLVPYLKKRIESHQWELRVVDRDGVLAAKRLGEVEPHTSSGALDIQDEQALTEEIKGCQLVISMVPAHMHLPVAKMCLKFGVHMVTASYATAEMHELNTEVQCEGLVFLNECGLDPGIDHMSAMKLLDAIRNDGGKVVLFESFTGGLLSPASEEGNPWRYKFTWNPRNVVLAGQGGAVKFIQEGKYKYIPPHMVFRRTEFMNVEGFGKFEGIANRDSLKYREVYGLENVETLYRGTLRRPGFARAWDSFVKLGMTDDSYQIANTHLLSFREFTNLFLAYNPQDSVELKLKYYLGIPQDSDLMDKLVWAGLFSSQMFPFESGSPAQCLEYILRQVWTLEESDKDLIVMYHKIGWEKNGGERFMVESSMGVEGHSATQTAMAATVGLPLAIAARLILEGKIESTGVQLPMTAQWYGPILEELSLDFGVQFYEKSVPYSGY
ncbi:MAG: saccharopine dehydrogenase NADP-binding domain-containing protein [Schleiferiaceae bacterium]|nr:saccharopine dehydrogenase NADP-binding domain-containing protein [Schleiferiaceae bacterium]